MVSAAARRESDRVAGADGFAYFQSLYILQDQTFAAFGLYLQIAANIDFHVRRIYFGLIANGDNTTRKPVRAHLDQILERLPKLVDGYATDLYRKKEFATLIGNIRQLVSWRNDVAHSMARWQLDGDVLLFAHVNEQTGRGIRTGEDIAYWVIDQTEFVERVAELRRVAGYLSQYTIAWLPKLRPWLVSTFNGKPDPDGVEANAFLDQMVRDAQVQ